MTEERQPGERWWTGALLNRAFSLHPRMRLAAKHERLSDHDGHRDDIGDQRTARE